CISPRKTICRIGACGCNYCDPSSSVYLVRVLNLMMLVILIVLKMQYSSTQRSSFKAQGRQI
ncbi:hypothetical protein AOQ84DRAFT_422483, partial [Glonium stellatum]